MFASPVAYAVQAVLAPVFFQASKPPPVNETRAKRGKVLRGTHHLSAEERARNRTGQLSKWKRTLTPCGWRKEARKRSQRTEIRAEWRVHDVHPVKIRMDRCWAVFRGLTLRMAIGEKNWRILFPPRWGSRSWRKYGTKVYCTRVQRVQQRESVVFHLAGGP